MKATKFTLNDPKARKWSKTYKQHKELHPNCPATVPNRYRDARVSGGDRKGRGRHGEAVGEVEVHSRGSCGDYRGGSPRGCGGHQRDTVHSTRGGGVRGAPGGAHCGFQHQHPGASSNFQPRETAAGGKVQQLTKEQRVKPVINQLSQLTGCKVDASVYESSQRDGSGEGRNGSGPSSTGGAAGKDSWFIVAKEWRCWWRYKRLV
ncbi:UNVERIFIED_CONTAM: hypothetical protein HDU68_012243 [Siphonaria sp. JEL0065]|nr:hypothetical protein HDU68_012243 [Siphonaria sp. JEL0065]